MLSHSLDSQRFPHPFPWYPSGCQTEACETTLKKIPKLADYNWCVTSEIWAGFELMRVQLLDINCGLAFLHSLEIVHGDLKGVRLNCFLYRTSVNSTHHPTRITFLLTSRAVRVSVISDWPASLVPTVQRLPGLGLRDLTGGWPPSSSTSAMEDLASPRANQTFLLRGWSRLR